MNLNKYIYIIVIGLVALVSCDDFLSIPNPYTPEEEFLKTEAGIMSANNEQFRLLAFGESVGGNIWFCSELMADNIEGEALSGDWGQYYNRRTNIFNGFTRDTWQKTYAAAAEANRILFYIDSVPGIDATTKTVIEGNAKFVRALVHFEMVRLFAQPYGYTADNSHPGIPYRNAWNRDALARSTVAEVYQNIMADIDDAIEALPESNPIGLVQANKWTAKALKTQVYFQMNDFQNAFDLSNEIVTMGPYAFDNDLTTRFSTAASSEYIFYHTAGNPIDFGPAGKFREQWENGAVNLSEELNILINTDADIRGALWTAGGRLKKATSNNLEHPIIHLTEIKLIRAESAAEIGMTGVALDDLNDIRIRAGIAELAPNTTAPALIQDAQLQRRLELVGEGDRLHDLQRIGANNNPNLEIRGAIWNCPGLTVQFPDDELSGNPGMETNPQAGC